MIVLHVQSYIQGKIDNGFLHGLAVKKRLLDLHVSFPIFLLASAYTQGTGVFPPLWDYEW